VSVSQLFYLDRFEVTVGRFRNFLASYTEWRQDGHPRQDEGEHPRIADTGWQERWNYQLPQEASGLEAEVENCFSIPFPNLHDAAAQNLPMNCVTWFEAFAFCIWDEGRLPTEIEWQHAATGGTLEDRIYPWGDVPEPISEYAVYDCSLPCEIPPVGSKPLGIAFWGQLDLAGSVAEWVFDGGDPYPESCSRDCANTTPEDQRMFRGGSFSNDASSLRSTLRNSASPELRNYFHGFRCARANL
jgi:formylglycine-generating enzyme required for sulfatase activity